MILTAVAQTSLKKPIRQQVLLVLQPVHFVALHFGLDGFPSYASLLDSVSVGSDLVEDLQPGNIPSGSADEGQMVFKWAVARRTADDLSQDQITQLLLDVKPCVPLTDIYQPIRE